MKPLPKCTLLAVLACLMLAFTTSARADDDENVPSFKSATDRETKEFVTKVGSVIIKAARLKPQKIELVKYEYTKPKAGRSELNLKMNYSGLLTKQKYSTDITILIDSSDKEKWEVLNIRYKDTNKSPTSPNEKKIQELIKPFNK